MNSKVYWDKVVEIQDKLTRLENQKWRISNEIAGLSSELVELKHTRHLKDEQRNSRRKSS